MIGTLYIYIYINSNIPPCLALPYRTSYLSTSVKPSLIIFLAASLFCLARPRPEAGKAAPRHAAVRTALEHWNPRFLRHRDTPPDADAEHQPLTVCPTSSSASFLLPLLLLLLLHHHPHYHRLLLLPPTRSFASLSILCTLAPIHPILRYSVLAYVRSYIPYLLWFKSANRLPRSDFVSDWYTGAAIPSSAGLV
jgi:hypothetical protein